MNEESSMGAVMAEIEERIQEDGTGNLYNSFIVLEPEELQALKLNTLMVEWLTAITYAATLPANSHSARPVAVLDGIMIYLNVPSVPAFNRRQFAGRLETAFRLAGLTKGNIDE